jgi:predicted nicotinamide N-methyase
MLARQLDRTAAGSPGALERLSGSLELERHEVDLGGVRLTLPEPADPVAFITRRMAASGAGADDLPYWTKLWPAALVLARFAGRLPAPQSGAVLEMGAGLGLPGLAAAAAGHQVILSDLDPDALEFARAGVELNRLEDKARVASLDWTAPLPADLGPVSTVLGAEILYHPPLYPHLVGLLGELVERGAVVYLSLQERPFKIDFFDLAREVFEVRGTKSLLRGGEEPTTVYLYRITKK